ncbi:MAG: PEP-utilizing enzyme, partial [Anaerolineales bacterium]|nr:PEP-utilizing enzyme [Anaerolineales bacterium]
NVPLINSIWIKLFTELVGKNDLKFDDLAKSFYYRSYFNLSALGQVWGKLGMPRESLEIVMGILPRPQEKSGFKPSWRMMRLVPRLLIFLLNRLGFGKHFEKDYPGLSARLDLYHWKQAAQLQEPELLGEINQLYDELQPFVYYNINIPLLMALYNALLERGLKKAGVDPTRFDLMAGMIEYLDITPDRFLKDLQQDIARLDPVLREQISRASYAEFQGLTGISPVQNKVSNFIQRFGHLSESGNDFSAVPWREKPETILKWITQDPVASEVVKGRFTFENLELSGLNRRWLGWLYDRARKFRLYREQISSLYTYGYGLFRPYYLALGAHLTRRGMLYNPEDIFYLHRDEIEEIVAAINTATSSSTRAPSTNDYGVLAHTRQDEMLRCQEVQLPTLIYGDQAPLLDITHQEKLTGVPTSGGYHTGPIKIVRGLEDFHKVQPGDVLVIPYSDVGWTPLFARAGAVIAESGGILSHSSIIAREYQIPAVVSVPDAMHLPDGALITVDGFRGEILLHKQ